MTGCTLANLLTNLLFLLSRSKLVAAAPLTDNYGPESATRAGALFFFFLVYCFPMKASTTKHDYSDLDMFHTLFFASIY